MNKMMERIDPILNFRNKNFFLSNFYEAPVTYNGLTYRNNEAAFQAQKVTDINIQKTFTDLTASRAKRQGRKVLLIPDWEFIKYEIMYDICMNKFKQNQDLKQLLLSTGNVHLEEGNVWGDTEWGTVRGEGRNKLGLILMDVRKTIREEERGKLL